MKGFSGQRAALKRRTSSLAHTAQELEGLAEWLYQRGADHEIVQAITIASTELFAVLPTLHKTWSTMKR